MVGPFIFIDHMGPAQMAPDDNMDIAPHPHIGLSTLTYLFDGNIMHKDSLGTEVEIKAGQVNWMTAGKGIGALRTNTCISQAYLAIRPWASDMGRSPEGTGADGTIVLSCR
jgi:hypothetical protein